MVSKESRLVTTDKCNLLWTCFYLCAVLLFTPFVHADGFPKEALSTELKEKMFKASLKEGYHFNDKAPNSVSIDGKTIKPGRIGAREVEFSELPTSWSSGRAALYVCDDALTYCIPNYIQLSSKQNAASAAVVSTANKGPGKKNKYGFIEDDYLQALKAARVKNGKGKLILIDFSAVWCPGCVRLEDEVFGMKKFKDVTRDFVKLKINVDLFESQVLMEKFNIGPIPALVVVNAEQEEIARVIDYQPIEFLDGFFQSLQKDPIPLKTLIADTKAKDSQAAHRVGKRLLSSGYYKESIPFFEKVQPQPPELWAARVGEASENYETNPESKQTFTKTLRDAIQAEPSSARSLVWRTYLVELLEDKSELKTIREEGVKAADALLADPTRLRTSMNAEELGEFIGYEPIWVSMYAALLVQGSGANESEKEAAWKKAYEAGRKLNIKAHDFGPAMRYVIVLTNAKMFREADALAVQLLKKDPGNTDLPRRRMKILMGLKNYDEAIAVGTKILPLSLGRNEFWVAESLAKAYIAADRKEEARTVIDRYLSREEIEWPHLKASKAELQKLKQGL